MKQELLISSHNTHEYDVLLQVAHESPLRYKKEHVSAPDTYRPSGSTGTSLPLCPEMETIFYGPPSLSESITEMISSRISGYTDLDRHSDQFFFGVSKYRVVAWFNTKNGPIHAITITSSCIARTVHSVPFHDGEPSPLIDSDNVFPS